MLLSLIAENAVNWGWGFFGAGLGALTGKIWRFGIMGYSCKMENVMLCLCALESLFDDMGAKIEIGMAEAAAYHADAAHPSRPKNVRAAA